MAASLALAGCGEFVLVREGEVFGAAPPLVAEDLSTTSMLSYYGLDGLLMKNVVAAGSNHEVLYRQLGSDQEGIGVVNFTLEQLAGVDPLALDTPDERLAFFMNLYNLGVLSGVLAELAADPSYDSVSVDNFLFFQVPRVSLGGHVWTLDQLEHGVVRGDSDFLTGVTDEQQQLAAAWHDAVWQGRPVDARLHVGVNCSAVSCPNLLREPFRGDTVWGQLDDAATAFVDDAAKGAGPNGISELFTWFEGDFEASHGSARDFVESYRSTGVGDVDFEARIPYDWALNGR